MAKKLIQHPNDDLFEGTSMSFGEHIEELRMGLFRAMIGLVIGFLIGLLFAKDVVTFIQVPLKNSLEKYYLVKATKKLEEEYKGKVPVEMLETIKTRRIVPAAMQVEPYGVLESFRANFPGAFELRFPRYQFAISDFANDDGEATFVPLAKALRQRDGATPEAQAIWRAMSAKQREAIAKVAKADPESLDADDKAHMVVAFNELLTEPDLHRAEGLSEAPGASSAVRETIEELAAMEKLGDDDLRRLNKLLLTSAMHPYLRTSQVSVIDLPVWKPTDTQVQALGPQEAFMIWMKAGLVSGVIFASPWIFWQLWVFVAAGLYPHEKKYVHIYLPFSLLLFLAGAAMAFFIAFEPVLDFLFTFNERMEIDPDPRISEWLGFVLFLPLGFGISFQMPLVMLFINRIGLVPLATYVQKWRIAILVIFVVSMILTPADPISMLLMAGPLTILYFFGILLCMWMPRNRNPFSEAYEPA